MVLLTTQYFSPEDFVFPELISQAVHVWDVLDLCKEFLSSYLYKGISGQVESGVYLKNAETIEVEAGAIIESGAYIVGPCFIGAGSVVRHGAYIRGGVIIGRNCVVGHCTELKNVYFGDGAKAAHFAYVGDSVLSSQVNLGAGVRCANFRLDGTDIQIKMGAQKIATGKKKLGAFLGKGVSIGCNTVLNPGCIIPSFKQVMPGRVCSGVL